MISDKAEACPKCGTPNVQEAVEKQTQQTRPQEVEQPQDSGSMRLANIIIGVIVVLFIGGIIWYTSHKSDEHLTDYRNETQSVAAQDPDSIVSKSDEREQNEALEKEKKRQMVEDIYNAYVQSVKKYAKDEYNSSEYFLFDITNDGIPELWIRHGTCEADYMLTAFTFANNRCEQIYDEGAGHSFFSLGSNYVIQCYAHMCYYLYKLKYKNGKVVSETICEEVMELPERTEANNEREAEFYSSDNTTPIKRALEITN